MVSYSCITLQNCQTDELVYVSTFTNSEVNLFFEAELGNVVQITDPENFPDIYYLVESICTSFQSTPGSACETCFRDAVSVGAEYLFSTGLDTCPTSTAYVLLNCKAGDITIDAPADLVQSPSTVLVTSSDLALYVGSVVNIAEYPDNCYTVLGPYTEDTGCPCEYYTVTDAHKDCECCLPEVPTVFVRTTQKPVKQFYHITDSECEIRTNTKFANNYYKLFNTIKNGMGNCCDGVDLDKLWIDKEMADYSRINPPGQCTAPAVPEEPVECPVTPLATCDLPEDVSGEGDFT
ncbi:hypothetical protein EB118_05835 [bacterium]|nr:hypothetical protein [bacterium]NDD82908.1 hypothetical protein [bacterium]NDG29602.1 hypothetical protein [bacterium]